jgi:Fe-S-cluster-containing dehydrogenase component
LFLLFLLTSIFSFNKGNFYQSNMADKCDSCAKRLKQGLEPVCVVTCPTGVRLFGEFNDASSRVSQLLKQGGIVRVVNPKADTEANTDYFDKTVPLDWPKEPEMPALEELKDI